MLPRMVEHLLEHLANADGSWHTTARRVRRFVSFTAAALY